MKKTVCSILTSLLCLLPAQAFAKLEVFACEPEWAYIATQIGGEHLKVFSATTPQQNAHYISAKPSLLAKMRKADIVFCSGSGLESGWLPVLLKSAGSAQVQLGNKGHIMASDHVQKLDVITDASLIDRSMGDIHPEGNPHIHLDPRRYVQVAAVFANTLGAMDEKNATTYQQNLEAFSSAWHDYIARWEQQAAGLRGKEIISYHTNFTYLADWLGLNIIATLEPKPGITPSSKHLATLVGTHKNGAVHKIIHTEYETSKAAKWLSQKLGVEALELPYSSQTDMVAVFDQIIEALQ